MLTHSPCNTAGVKTASIAWPIECPKLTRLRRPVSRSSMVTMWAFTEMEPWIIERRRDWEEVRVEMERPVGHGEGDWIAENISEDRDSRRANSDADHIAAVLV